MKTFLRSLSAVIALALLGSFLVRTLSGPDAENRSAKRSADGSPLVAFALAAGGGPPNADAGLDQSVAPGAIVVLDASGSSDPEGDELSFAWSLESLPNGSLALISDPAAIKPSFQADEPGDYVARLTATGRFGTSAARAGAGPKIVGVGPGASGAGFSQPCHGPSAGHRGRLRTPAAKPLGMRVERVLSTEIGRRV